ncbi:hypothetical protein, conserved [Babesia ovata]|uniref:Uncharacterized protein n=1 Tax=Babesia ovata TaxID=189622 RepID=A0A2H6KCC6_9APIC|nr:uncharacterized protein BOVATA_021350 [Babesia ovata]GBE60642.1 hypothetical protein, conserved [Babesia ovata]
MKLQMCKSRRRMKEAVSAASHPAGEILVDESETELVNDEFTEETPVGSNELSTANPSLPSEEPSVSAEVTTAHGEEDGAPEVDGDAEGEEDVSEKDDSGVQAIEAYNGGESYLDPFGVASIEDRRSFSQDFSKMQDYCNDRLYELMTNQEVALKCVREIVPSLAQSCLAATTECQSCQPIVTGCLGLGDSSSVREVENNEFRVVEDRGSLDAPTIPTGIWVVDTINQALDKWSDSERVGALGSLFKLLNLSAMLTYLGDTSGDRIVALLTRTSSVITRGPEAWREILRCITSDSISEPKSMPVVPNASFVSRCEAKLDDVPDMDNSQLADGPFKAYWTYTERWMRMHFSPSISSSRDFTDQAREWFNSLDTSAQELLTRLSRALCFRGP